MPSQSQLTAAVKRTFVALPDVDGEDAPTDVNSAASATATREVSILDEEEVYRGQWAGSLDFLMSMIAYAVGLGNVWRFPYLCFKNGGGSFLVVYFLFFMLGAVPIFVMEVTMGQYLQRGAMKMWKICPLFKGVGIGNVVISFMCAAYFCVITAWALYYMIASFSYTFPWETCDNYWNDYKCITGKESPKQLATIVANLTGGGIQSETSVEQFWEKRVLMQTDSIHDFGGIQWELFGLMLFSWVLVYFALWKGITNARKFVYFCALFPYFLIFVLLIRGLTLPGAWTGLSFYLTPNIMKLSDTTVWKDAGTQVFYSYGVGFGTLIALGSHNKINHNCYRDAMVMCCVNGGTSLLAGTAVFSILGYMSVIADKNIAEIVKPGVGLAFLAYPEVASNLPLKQLWAFLFFLMIFILGLDSQVCMVEGLFTALEDTFPNLLRKHKKKSLFVCCLIFFVIGLPMVTYVSDHLKFIFNLKSFSNSSNSDFYAGAHWLTLVDAYGASGIALLFVVFFEVVGLTWGFGAHRVRQAIREMLDFYPNPIFPYLWKFTAPFVAATLFIFCIVMYHPLQYPNGEIYPLWAQIFGFCLSGCSMIVIPGYAIYYVFIKKDHQTDGLSVMRKVQLGMHPQPDLIDRANRKIIHAKSQTQKGMTLMDKASDKEAAR